MPRKRKTPNVLTLRISLVGSKPEIWRRVQVTDDISLQDLHNVIQIAMGWQDCHLHEFEIAGKRYTKVMSDVDMLEGVVDVDESEFALRDLVTKKGQRIEYVYDFGDDWVHTLLVEDISKPDGRKFYPRCVDGERSGPPEDCGGVWGYANMLAALDDPDHDMHEECIEWIGPDWDAEDFRGKQVNAMFKDFDNYVTGWDDYPG